jgi:hypothetical protein
MRQFGSIGDDVDRLDMIIGDLQHQYGAGLAVDVTDKARLAVDLDQTEKAYWSAYRFAAARSRRNCSAVRRGP